MTGATVLFLETAGLTAQEWNGMLGAIQSGAHSPRAGKPLLLSSPYTDQIISRGTNSSVLVLDNWKLIEGTALGGVWTGPAFPNASGYPYLPIALPKLQCGGGCLFDVVQDPGEHGSTIDGSLTECACRAPSLPNAKTGIDLLDGCWPPTLSGCL